MGAEDDEDDDEGDWDVAGELSAAELAEINAARSDDQTDGDYFDSYAHLGIHREMIGEGRRQNYEVLQHCISSHRPY